MGNWVMTEKNIVTFPLYMEVFLCGTITTNDCRSKNYGNDYPSLTDPWQPVWAHGET